MYDLCFVNLVSAVYMLARLLISFLYVLNNVQNICVHDVCIAMCQSVLKMWADGFIIDVSLNLLFCNHHLAYAVISVVPFKIHTKIWKNTGNV